MNIYILGTFKRFINTKTKIYVLHITDIQYKQLEDNIKQIEEQKQNYKFNIIGLIAVGFNKKIKIKNSFYCAEFVKTIIEKSNINIKLPDLVRPENFKNINELQLIYEGFLREYKVPKITKLIEKNISKKKVQYE